MNCPTNDDLLAYVTGRIEEPTLVALAEHIRDCETCQTRLSTIDDSQDSLLASLRRTPEVDAYEQEPQCEQAAQLAAALMPVAAGHAVGAACLADSAGGDAECPPTFLTDEPRSEPAATADTTAAFVRELGEYELLEKLGEGGMGAVYKARHRRLDKIVAVKVLPPDRMADPLALARFDREMRAVGRLTHPNIVQAFDAREIGGTHFLAMEYVAGMDLGDVVLNGGAMRIADACEVVRQMASGLVCAHENGLVHRDIKPSNAILTPGGQVKLLDLGLARLSGGPTNVEASRGEMTTSGTAMGTADYMAPEQATDSHTADIRADLYSLGCTLYKLLSGKPPFSGPKYKNNMEKIMGHLRDVPPPITLLRTDVTADLAAVIDRMMAKDREQRFATPQEVVDALQPFASGANLPRLYREADAMRRGEPLVEPSVMGTEPGAPSAVSDTTRNLECGALSPLLSSPKQRQTAPGFSSPLSASPPLRVSPASHLRRPAVLIALGFFGAAILAGVIIIRITQKSGKETIVEIPEGDLKSVTIEDGPSRGTPAGEPGRATAQSGDKAPHSKMPVGIWVPLLKSEEDLKAWQKTGAGTVTFDNGAVRVQNAAVTYPTLAIDLVIRVQIQIEVDVKPTARLLLRQTPAGSYAAVLDDGSKLVLGVTEGDKWRELKSTPVTVAADQPVAFEFSVVGKVLTVLLNGKPAIEVQDRTHSYGAPGLAAMDDVTVFKDVDIKVVRDKEVELAKTKEQPHSGKPVISPPSAPAGPSVAKSVDKVPPSKMAFPVGQWVPVWTSEGELPLRDYDKRGDASAKFTPDGIELSYGALDPPLDAADMVIRARVKKVSGMKLGLTLRHTGDAYCGARFLGGNEFHVVLPDRILTTVRITESFPEFFDFAFAAVGNQFLVFANGRLIIRAEDSNVVRGHADCAAIGGTCIFRNVEVKVLTSRDGSSGPLPLAVQERLIAELEAEHLPPWNLADDTRPPAIAPFDPKQARQHQEAWAKHLGVPVETSNSVGMKLMLIPPGEYDMGLTTEDMEAANQDIAKAAPALAGYFARTLPLATPKHRVRVPRPFQLGACEVTQEQFQRFVNETGYRTTAEDRGLGTTCWTPHPDSTWVLGSPVSWRTPAAGAPESNAPVVNVSVYDAWEFCEWLSQKEQADYRIPTEEEWEFACCAGGTGRYGFLAEASDLPKFAWMDQPVDSSGGRPNDRPQAVGQKLPNPFGLYDTLGNVCEPCWKSFYPNEAFPNRLCLRGGVRGLPSVAMPHLHRIPVVGQDYVRNSQGFRIVREVPTVPLVSPDDPTAAERWVANWLLQGHAQLTIRCGGTTQPISAVEALPTESFQVESVTLGPTARFDPAELTYLQRLSSLSVLNLDTERLNARAVARLVGLKKLTELRIGKTHSRYLSAFGYLAKNDSIRKVSFVGSGPSDRTLAQLAAFRNLEELELCGRIFTDDGLRHLAGLSKLRRLVLTDTAVGDPGLKHLGGMKALAELNLASTRVTDAGLAHLAGCKTLETLDLRKTAVTGTGLAPLAGLKRLVTLRLDSSKLTDDGCAGLGHLTTLRILEVSNTYISEAGIAHLKNLSRLVELRLWMTPVSDEGLSHLGGLTNLETLVLGITTVSDQGLAHLRSLKSLQYLDLGFTRCGDESLNIVTAFPRLQYLSLYGTRVTDAHLGSLVRLSALKTLYLDGSNVTSEGVVKTKGLLPQCNVIWRYGQLDRSMVAADLATKYGGLTYALVEPDGKPAQRLPTDWNTSLNTAGLPIHVLELSSESSANGDAFLNEAEFLTSIRLINLKNARITNRGVQDLAGLKTLETLILDANQIDDSALPHLYGLSALRSLSLRATRVTPAGVQALMDKLPECRVESDFLVARTGGPLFAQSPVTQPAAIPGLRNLSVLPIAHRDSVTAVACNPAFPDLIALAGDDGEKSPATVRVWNRQADAPEASPVWIGFGHTKNIQALAWSPDGKYLASTGQDLTVKVWEPAAGRCLRTFQLNSPGNALAWSPTMDRVAVACDASVALITLKDGELREVADAAIKSGLAWSPDGARFVVGTGTPTTFTLTVYDAATWTADRAITSEELAGQSAIWSPDGKQLAATLGDGIVRIWDVETLERVRDLTAPAGAVGLLAWSTKGDRLASAGKQLIVWDAEKGTQLASCPLESGAPLGLSWTADGQHVAVSSAKDIGIHSGADGTLVDAMSVTGPIPVAKLTVQPDGHYRAIGPIADQLVYVVLTDDYRQETYTPAAFAVKFGWKN